MLDFDAVKTLLYRKLSHRFHPLVYECKQICNNLLGNEVDVELMWIPSHVVVAVFHGSILLREWLLDLLIPNSRGFFFNLGLKVKIRKEICFHYINNNVWALCGLVTPE
jgi:hypothetical protein